MRGWTSIIWGGLSLMATELNAEPGTDPATRAREELILGHPVRVAPLTELSDEMKAVAKPPPGFTAPGEVPEFFRIMAKNPELLKSFHGMGLYFLLDAKLPLRDREIAILRVGWLLQAPYEWGEHVNTARRLDALSGDEIARIMEGPEAQGWSEHDRAILRAVDELLKDAMISDATWTTLSKTFDEAQMLELPILVGNYQAVAYLQNSLRMTLRPGNKGLKAR